MTQMEHEAKFWLPDYDRLMNRLVDLGAPLTTERHLERNLRFDTPQRSLTVRGDVLRLRDAHSITLTFKQQGDTFETRREWEVTVSDLSTAQAILEGLGYQQFFIYEKYRCVYRVEDCQVMLDEVPFGCFAEVEGPELGSVRRVCYELHLDWQARLQHSYLDLFEALRDRLEPQPAQATFAAFAAHHPVVGGSLGLTSGYHSGDDEGS